MINSAGELCGRNVRNTVPLTVVVAWLTRSLDSVKSAYVGQSARQFDRRKWDQSDSLLNRSSDQLINRSPMLQMMPPAPSSTLVHSSPRANSVTTSRPGQISRPLCPSFWNRRVRKPLQSRSARRKNDRSQLLTSPHARLHDDKPAHRSPQA
jgi:hypothetical protein